MYILYKREYIIPPSFLHPQLQLRLPPAATAVNRMKLNDYPVDRPATHADIHQAHTNFAMNLFMACFMAKETSGNQYADQRGVLGRTPTP